MCPTPTLWILWLLLILHFYKQVHEEHLCHALMVLAQSSLTTNSQQRNYWVKICAHFKAIVAGGGTQGLRCSTAELHPHINTFRLIMLKSGLPSHQGVAFCCFQPLSHLFRTICSRKSGGVAPCWFHLEMFSSQM